VGHADPELGAAAEKAAVKVNAKLSLASMGIRQYLESTVVSLLSQGMAALVSPRESPVPGPGVTDSPQSL